MKSQSTEDYLKAIYQLQELNKGETVSTSALASWLGVANASVTGMVKRFSSADPKLVEYEPYTGFTLTDAGEKMALEVIRHHRLIECYLCRALGFSWDEVHEEAERLEHVISETMEDRMALALGNPIVDPHGDPIPDREGNFKPMNAISLIHLPLEQHGEIRRVMVQEPEFLRYLSAHRLFPSARVQLISKAPFNGPISIRIIGPSDTFLALGQEVAKKILVQPISTSH
jgi:DtxR family Mn-dependent transcriptional regulator